MTRIRVVWLSSAALLWAEGVLDGAVAAELHAEMDGLIARDPELVVLDLSEVLALDEGAIAVLAAATVRLRYAGVTLELRLPGERALTVPDATVLRQVLSAAYPPVGPTETW